MQKTKSDTKTLLSEWLFKIPVKFTIIYSILSVLLIGLFAGLKTLINLDDINVLLLMLFIGFVFTGYYYIIKKLPHGKTTRNDLIAITNGCSMIAIIIPLILLLFIGTNPTSFQNEMKWLYLLHPNIFTAVAITIFLIVLYLSGVAVSGIYAKYKRAVTMGISKWKIFLSMPFAFLLIWMPGYLIPDPDEKSDLKIKSKWYSKFNKFVISDSVNTIFVFLMFLLFRNIFSGLPLLLLTAFLLVLYTIWKIKYKTNLKKYLNCGYALSAVFINITIIIAMLIFR